MRPVAARTSSAERISTHSASILQWNRGPSVGVVGDRALAFQPAESLKDGIGPLRTHNP